ncbi:urokinase plasminogen activator surface receptor isoform X2 [Phascolarctos cinereus]|uniref:Urokinase plasminogen activator surface receptor n=1 Tax=Phascolarctos cinereus TaxID=38626 RepID=A0A6P5LTR5_PHACI|nr:urokinase plasminogen activator surface receptor isoform X2 [Phascolarctos cinereus]
MRALTLSLLLLAAAHAQVSSGLSCHHCESRGDCTIETCLPGQELCRTTVYYNRWRGGQELEVVLRGCAVTGKDNSSMSYRTNQEIIILKETVCDFDLCNHPDPRPSPTFPGARTLECQSCASSDQSCERGRALTLRCPEPTDQCIERISQSNLEAGPLDERYVRGCGNFPDCPGPVGFHNNDTFLFLKCCNHSQCIRGPMTKLSDYPLNGLQCHSCEGNGTDGCSAEETAITACQGPMNRCFEATGTHKHWGPGYTVRGCVAPAWCQAPHLAAAFFDLAQPQTFCCFTSECNNAARDASPRSKGTGPRLFPTSLTLSLPLLLLTVNLTPAKGGLTQLYPAPHPHPPILI